MANNEETRGIIRTERVPEEPSVTIIQTPTQVVMYNITEQELDNLSAGFTSIRATFLGIALGALVTVLSVLLTIDLSDRGFAVFIGGVVTSGGFTLFFGVGFIVDLKRYSNRVNTIKRRRTEARR